MRMRAKYRCRHCGEIYLAGEYDGENLRICTRAAGMLRGERIPPDPFAAALFDIHQCDVCMPRCGVADLVGWE